MADKMKALFEKREKARQALNPSAAAAVPTSSIAKPVAAAPSSSEDPTADLWNMVRSNVAAVDAKKDAEISASAKAAADVASAAAKKAEFAASIRKMVLPQSRVANITFVDITQLASGPAPAGAFEACDRFITAATEWVAHLSNRPRPRANPLVARPILRAIRCLMNRWLRKDLPIREVKEFDLETVVLSKCRKTHRPKVQPIDMPTRMHEADGPLLLAFIDAWEVWTLLANRCIVRTQVDGLKDILRHSSTHENPDSIFHEYRELVGRMIDRVHPYMAFEDDSSESDDDAESASDLFSDEEEETPRKKKQKKRKSVDSPAASPPAPSRKLKRPESEKPVGSSGSGGTSAAALANNSNDSVHVDADGVEEAIIDLKN